MANTNYGENVHLFVRSGSAWVPMTQPTSGSGGTSSTFGAAVPATGTAVGFQDNSGNMALGLLDASGNLKVNVAAGGAGGGAVTVADGADVAEGATTDAAVLDAAGTVNSHARGIVKILADVWDSVNHFLKVNIQNASLAITAASLPLPSGAATSAKQDTGNTSLSSIDGKVPALGQALAASSVPVVLTAAQISTLTPPAAITGFATESTLDTRTGSLTETAPATDTASSGINGRLQRIAQRISSLITALGSPFQAGGSIGNTSFASTVADGANVTLGAKADAKSTATDTTAVTAMQVLKQISASVQAPPSQAVTNAGTFAVQAAITAASGSIASGAIASGAIASGAVASGAIASGAIASGAIAAGAIAAGATSIADNEDAASADGDRGVKILAVRKATPANTSGTDGDYEFPQISAGRLWASSNVDQINGVTPLMGAGNSGTGALRVSISTDDVNLAAINAVSGTTAGAKVITDASGTIQQYLRGLIYQLITAGASFFTPTPGTTGGWSMFNATSGDGSTALTNTAQAIKASQGTLGGWYIYNPNASAVAYVCLYNVASGSVTVGTTNPAIVIAVPAGAAANLEIGNGLQFSTAISVAAATTAGGNTALGTAVEANFWYK